MWSNAIMVYSHVWHTWVSIPKWCLTQEMIQYCRLWREDSSYICWVNPVIVSDHHRRIWDYDNNTISVAVWRVYHRGGSCLWRFILLDKMKLMSGKCFGSMPPPRGPTPSVLASQCFEKAMWKKADLAISFYSITVFW